MKRHWPEYLSEFLGTGLMVFIGLSAVAVNFGAGSPMEGLLPGPRLRLLLTACLFAAGGETF
ncbi:MAG: hypothetical protein HY548_09250 [Elusimicrobia bacterium]|nr:hypothetical protein [Elusimicrobiota bacterium]